MPTKLMGYNVISSNRLGYVGAVSADIRAVGGGLAGAQLPRGGWCSDTLVLPCGTGSAVKAP